VVILYLFELQQYSHTKQKDKRRAEMRRTF